MYRKSQEGIVSKDGAVNVCFACIARRHAFHPGPSRNGQRSLLCKLCQVKFGRWSSDVCFRVRFVADPVHPSDEGCRFVG